MTQLSECEASTEAVGHYLLFRAVQLFTLSLSCMSGAGVNDNEIQSHPLSSPLYPSHLILSGTLWVWLPSVWQLPAYCARLLLPWSRRRAIAPWVSTETPLAMRLQD